MCAWWVWRAERFRRVECLGVDVRDSPLLFGLASVFAGLTTMLAVVAIVTREAFVLAVALPFAATGYFMWYQATGRMRERVEEAPPGGGAERFAEQKAREGTQSRFAREARRRMGRDRQDRRRRGTSTAGGRRRRREPGGVGAGPGPGGFEGSRDRRSRAGQSPDEPSLAEARSLLDVDPTATQEAIRRAYRERVKEVHPDTADGDEETFKRVTAAYERLADD